MRRTCLAAVARLASRIAVALGMALAPGMALAGTCPIHVETEGSGDIITVSGQRNTNGAMVWNGTAWVVNTTWAHKFFVDVCTGKRLKEYTGKDVTVSGYPDPETQQALSDPRTWPADGYGGTYPGETFGNYTITRRLVVYTTPCAPVACLGSYRYAAVEYRISDTITAKDVILRSRGSGHGTAQAFFDIFIDDDVTGGGQQTTALLGDPAWYTFGGVKAADALALTPDDAHKTGDLPGALSQQHTPAADYYLDQGGGSDMGGRSFELHTYPIAPSGCLTANRGSSYPSDFSLKYMDSSGNLQKITVAPTVVAEIAPLSPLLFPGVASSAGSGGTMWRSEAVLVNPGTTAQAATLDLIPRDAAIVSKTATRTIPPGQLLRIADLYADLGAASGAGMLRVSGDLLAWVRTFNQGATGTFGQDVPPASLGEAFAASTDVLFPVTTPADQTKEYRSNLLLVNLESAPITFTLTAGSKTATKTVPGGTYTQVDKVGTFLKLPAGLAVLAVRATGRWAGTVSTVDPGSGDPTTVRGLLPTTRTVVLFPGVASVAGSLSTQWRSEAVLYNAGTAAKTVLLEILPKDGSSVAASTSLQLQPKEVRRLADLYAELHAASGSGLLRVTGNVLAWVRTYNQGASATFGQDVPPVLPAGGTEAGSEVLYPVSKPGDKAKEFRSNLILYNHGTAKLTCTVTAGTKSRTTDVPAGAYAQVNDVGTWLGAPAGWTTITVKANGRWSGTVSTIDPYTGDPTTVVGIAR